MRAREKQQGIKDGHKKCDGEALEAMERRERATKTS